MNKVRNYIGVVFILLWGWHRFIGWWSRRCDTRITRFPRIHCPAT